MLYHLSKCCFKEIYYSLHCVLTSFLEQFFCLFNWKKIGKVERNVVTLIRSAFYDLQVAAEIYINVFHYPDNHSFASNKKITLLRIRTPAVWCEFLNTAA